MRLAHSTAVPSESAPARREKRETIFPKSGRCKNWRKKKEEKERKPSKTIDLPRNSMPSCYLQRWIKLKTRVLLPGARRRKSPETENHLTGTRNLPKSATPPAPAPQLRRSSIQASFYTRFRGSRQRRAAIRNFFFSLR